MELWHILNRGVEKRNIFMDGRDYVRFVHDLYEFNDIRPASNIFHFFKNRDVALPYIEREGREPIVTIHGWCLMQNHYHLLISELREGGLTTFMRKLNTGYTNYFNERYRRSGVLFQGRTKKVQIKSDAHFLHILNYIHLNPLDYLESADDWRTRRISDSRAALEYLEKYRWSSYRDYCGITNLPALIETDLFSDAFKDYRREISQYLKDIALELSDTAKLLLE